MKHLLLSFLLTTICANLLIAQRDTTANAPTYEMKEITTPPSFPGGERELLRFLAETIQYPRQARKKGIQGIVAVTFVIDREGQVSDGTIIKDIGKGCGQEVLRVLNRMPRWMPAKVDDQPVKVRFTLPVRFRLD